MSERKEYHFRENELDTVVEAGKILMESGAEIYRIKETMTHMAAALQIERFDAFVINRGIFASGTNCEGVQEAKIANVPDAVLHLGRIEAVNALSREIEARSDVSLDEIADRLEDIRKEINPPLWILLLAYCIAAGSFSCAIGSTFADSLASGICGLVLGLTMYIAKKYVRAAALRTTIVSAVVTISANLLYMAGMGQHRGLMILGAFVVLVPGVAFTNSIREFSQNNYSTGMTLLMSSTLTCLAMTIGVVIATEFLPFVHEMTDSFSGTLSSPLNILIRALMAGLGTMAFSVLFHAPRKYYLDQGIMGATSWIILQLMNLLFHNAPLSIFTAALTAALLARLMAVRRKCPSTIFLSVCIFPLIPGLSFYRGVYFLITENEALGWNYMRTCFSAVFAIAFAITIANQIPERVIPHSKQ